MSGRQERAVLPDERRLRILRQMAKDGHTAAEVSERLMLKRTRVLELAAREGIVMAKS